MFKDMVDYGHLDLGNALHMVILWFCYARVIQVDLNKVRDHWCNSHKITKSGYYAINGVPDVMYRLQEYYGMEEFSACSVRVSKQALCDVDSSSPLSRNTPCMAAAVPFSAPCTVRYKYRWTPSYLSDCIQVQSGGNFGSLSDFTTSNHRIFRLNPSTAPCIAKPNGFNLSYPVQYSKKM